MINKFTAKKISEKNITVGEFFKQKRKERGFVLEEAAEKLQIRESYLRDLEEGNYDNLPPDVYVKGFIRKYADFVGLDAAKIIRLYNHEKSAKEKIERKTDEKKKELKFIMPKYTLITPKIITVFFSFLVLFLAGYYFYYQVNSFRVTPYLFVSNPAYDKIIDTPEILVEGKTDAETILKINGEDVFVDSNGGFKESITLQPGRNIIIVEATNRFNRSAREERNIIYEKKPEISVPEMPVSSGDSSLKPSASSTEENTAGKKNDDKNNSDGSSKIETIGP